jgi:hypothetical protein
MFIGVVILTGVVIGGLFAAVCIEVLLELDAVDDER